MIKFLKHSEIDIRLWDSCVNSALVELPYALYDYLNIVSPYWDAIVFVKNGQYEWVFPLPVRSKFFFKYVSQPMFTQQLGFYYTREPSKDELNQVLILLKRKYILVDLADNVFFNSINYDWPNNKRVTHHLDLSSSYEDLYGGYNKNRKRILNKMNQELVVDQSSEISKLLDMFRLSKGKGALGVDLEAENTLKSLFFHPNMNNIFRLYYVKKGEVELAGGLFIFYRNKIIFLFGSVSEMGKKDNAMTYLFDYLINDNASSDLVLDFEGSTVESVSRFYKSFGGEPVRFNQIKFSKIPLFVR